MLASKKQSLEDQIYRYEASYLEETGAGNIIKGFDNYIKGASTSSSGAGNAGGGTSTRRKGTIMEQDRVFSRSSASFMRVYLSSARVLVLFTLFYLFQMRMLGADSIPLKSK